MTTGKTIALIRRTLVSKAMSLFLNMMILLILTGVLGYELKTAIGTSVFIMTFTALTGAISHFSVAGGVAHWGYLIVCVISTYLFAEIGARIANRITAKTLNRATGLLLTVLGIAIVCVSYFK